MALYMAIFAGGTPLGAPLVGWVADLYGPRWAIGVAAVSGLLAAAIVLFWMIRYQRLRVRIRPRTSPRSARLHVRHRGDGHPLTAAIRVVPTKTAASDRDRETATREIAIVEATSPR
jgi:MFS family permease